MIEKLQKNNSDLQDLIGSFERHVKKLEKLGNIGKTKERQLNVAKVVIGSLKRDFNENVQKIKLFEKELAKIERQHEEEIVDSIVIFGIQAAIKKHARHRP